MPEVTHGCRRLAWARVCESPDMLGITYTGSDGCVKVQTMSYADDAYYSWEYVAQNHDLAHWVTRGRCDGVAFGMLTLEMLQLLLSEITTVFSTNSALTDIDSTPRSQTRSMRDSAVLETSSASPLGRRGWLPVEGGQGKIRWCDARR